jgi:hypothetical protein
MCHTHTRASSRRADLLQTALYRLEALATLAADQGGWHRVHSEGRPDSDRAGARARTDVAGGRGVLLQLGIERRQLRPKLHPACVACVHSRGLSRRTAGAAFARASHRSREPCPWRSSARRCAPAWRRSAARAAPARQRGATIRTGPFARQHAERRRGCKGASLTSLRFCSSAATASRCSASFRFLAVTRSLSPALAAGRGASACRRRSSRCSSRLRRWA